MRATVTIDDALFIEADQIAKEIGLSRSKVYQEALRDYLQRHRERLMTRKANEQIAKYGQPTDSEFRRYVEKAWQEDMGDDEW